ncbi:unnamed protein product, partial [Closterium sp. NIES-54]
MSRSNARSSGNSSVTSVGSTASRRRGFSTPTRRRCGWRCPPPLPSIKPVF